MSINLDVKTLKSGFWHMPKTFYAVLFIEFWERFAFYGLQSIAVIYFVSKFGLLESNAGVLFGSFAALLYSMLIIGGIIGDKFLGLRRTYLLGILFLIAGYGTLFLSLTLNGLYLGMGLVLVGNILFKTNATNYVGRCFESGDPRLDSAFTYFYMSVNLGSFLSLILVPVISHAYGYQVGLSLMAVGMVIALFSYLLFIGRFKSSDNQVGKSGKNMWFRMVIIAIFALALAMLFSYLLKNLLLSKIILYSASILILVVYLYVASHLNHHEARGMYIALLLMIEAIVFYILYIQTATSMILFALHNVRLSLLGYSVPPGATQSLNGFFIIVLSPLLANLYMWRQKKKGADFPIPGKFASGLIITGLCFVALGFGAQFFADQNSQVSLLWLVLGYILYSCGELLVSAIGPSMVTQLLPKRLGGFAQGIWFLASALGFQIGSQLSTFAAVDNIAHASSQGTLGAYMNLYYKLGTFTVLVGLGLILLIKPTYRAMEQVRQHKA